MAGIKTTVIQEHSRLEDYNEPYPERYNKISSAAHPLIKWTDEPSDNSGHGYYASYNIGAQWVNEKRDEAIVVAPKMEGIDFVRMFMTCFGSGIAVNEFNKIYEISVDEHEHLIETDAFESVLSLLIVIHFLSVVGRIKSLKKGYIHRSENLKKVKGHINILKNERKNIMMKRFDRVFCEYDEYSVDIPENRLIKKALLFARQVVNKGEKSSDMGRLRVLMAKDLAMFEQVSAEVEIRDVKQIRGHKLYAEYKEAIRLAKLILRHYDYNISKVSENKAEVVPFVIDMPLLYEHYVLGLLCEAYGEKHIEYQYNSEAGDMPDILFLSEEFPAILDTKYKPQYENIKPCDYLYSEYRDDIRQLSGYGRNKEILGKLGYDVSKEHVPYCVIIYPKGSPDAFENSFKGKSLRSLCVEDPNYLKFYKICVPLPMSK